MGVASSVNTKVLNRNWLTQVVIVAIESQISMKLQIFPLLQVNVQEQLRKVQGVEIWQQILMEDVIYIKIYI